MHQQEEEWFGTWFDLPYYHMLYQNRDTQEAYAFIDKLLGHLQTKPTYTIMYLACGRDCHAVYLNQQGFDVKRLLTSILWFISS